MKRGEVEVRREVRSLAVVADRPLGVHVYHVIECNENIEHIVRVSYLWIQYPLTARLGPRIAANRDRTTAIHELVFPVSCEPEPRIPTGISNEI